ncbi:MAG TPA: UDP-3-O-(3-hydroxymyristoyl)glucosamine N-acyltransferase [Stellaceae bacterium]|jgi:UDP-3-O-[3-hydroxymyristoyl] glucosamine N-acyltransferase|nr:UDP-3-O-(3-hydroxymyristoyl)glucosamine N-acyltransferase [Stellaceae bacterium]
MADPRFFDRAGPYSLAALGALTGARLHDAGDGGRLVADVAPLETAGPDDLTFLDNRKYVDAFAGSRAGAALVGEQLVGRAPAGMALLIASDPYKAFARAAQAFYPVPPVVPRRDPSAVIDPTATVPADCDIGPHVVIEAGARIGARCQIGANTVIGAAVELGDDCRIGANVTLSHCLIGARVMLHPGVRIGQPGFGFAPDREAPVKVPQLGRVIVGDDVDIGANTTIDRGSGHDTVIGAGTMIDNLVQIGHNVAVGRGCILAGQVGVSGSTKLGDFVMAGGQAGFAGHLRIGSGARVAAKSGLMRDVAPGETVSGIPAVPIGSFMRQVALLQRLAKKKDGR